MSFYNGAHQEQIDYSPEGTARVVNMVIFSWNLTGLFFCIGHH